jgi:hypothetical protein
MRIFLALAPLALSSAACEDFRPKRYAIEVGYYRGTGIEWEIWGDFPTLEECRNQAIARYNFYEVEQHGRAYSWACLLKNGKGGYASRHR